MSNGVSAGFGRRFAALLYDALLLTGLLLLFSTPLVVWVAHVAITPESKGAWAYLYRAGLLAILFGYYLINWIRSGQTLGMRAWHLRLVTDAGRGVPFKSACLRLVFSWVAWAPLALGVLWLYLDSEHAAWHDRWSHTRVVRLTGA